MKHLTHFALIFMLALSACSDPDNTNSSNSSGSSRNPLVGSWLLTKQTVDHYGEIPDWYPTETVIYTFRSDFTFSESVDGGYDPDFQAGKSYSLDRSVQTVTIVWVRDKRTYKYALPDPKHLELQEDDNGYIITRFYTKTE